MKGPSQYFAGRLVLPTFDPGQPKLLSGFNDAPDDNLRYKEIPEHDHQKLDTRKSLHRLDILTT